MLHNMVSTSHRLPGRRVSAISILLVGLIGVAVSYTLPKEHEPETKEGVYAPLVFPMDEWKYGAPGYLTPQNSSHLSTKELSQTIKSQTSPSGVPELPENLKNVSISNNSDGLSNINPTKDAVITKETKNVLEDSKAIDGLKRLAPDFSGSQDNVGGEKIEKQDVFLNNSAASNITKVEGEKQVERMSTKLENFVENATATAESLISNSVSEIGPTRSKIISAESHWQHDHVSSKGVSVPFTQSPEVAILLAALFVAVALVGYFGLVCWRRVLEEKYGNRELLVNEEEYDIGM